jgi:hypothetical protein
VWYRYHTHCLFLIARSAKNRPLRYNYLKNVALDHTSSGNGPPAVEIVDKRFVAYTQQARISANMLILKLCFNYFF